VNGVLHSAPALFLDVIADILHCMLDIVLDVPAYILRRLTFGTAYRPTVNRLNETHVYKIR
jgi:hypothetical protein